MWRKFSKNFISVLVVGLLCSCGGGSAGTGTGTRTIEGTVSDSSGAAVVGAEVMLVDTGESTITDSNGEFSLATEAGSTAVQLEIKSGEVSSTVSVNNVAAESLTVQVEITVDRDSKQILLDDLEMLAKIVGECDIYFENNRVIRQANKAPLGVECTAKVWIRSGGQPASSVPFAVQYRGCKHGQPLTTIAVGETRFSPEPGVGQVQFKFSDDEEHCVYRIVAPYGVEGQKPIVFEVDTFTKQAEKD